MNSILLAFAALGTLFVVGCENEVRPVPEDLGEGGAAPMPKNRRLVRVESTNGESPELDILVHDREGKLRARHPNQPSGQEVVAEPGDSVSVVWRQGPADPRWVQDSARVLENTHSFRFLVGAQTEAEPNPPIRVEAQLAIAEGIAERRIGASCSPWVSVPENEAYVLPSFVGCVGSAGSSVVALGLDLNERVTTFDYFSFGHRFPEIGVLFPMQAANIVKPILTVDWSSLNVETLTGSANWHPHGLTYSDPVAGSVHLQSPQSPVQHEARLVDTDFGVTDLSWRATYRTSSSQWCGVAEWHGNLASDFQWTLDRLAAPRLADDGAAWALEAQGERGGAVLVLADHGAFLRRWTLPPEAGPDWIPLPAALEMPSDLAPYFSEGATPAQIEVQHVGEGPGDPFSDPGYPGYVGSGIGHQIPHDLATYPAPAFRGVRACQP